MFGIQLNRRQRVLDLVRDLSGHLGPGLEAVRAFELRPLPLEIARHRVEVLHQPAQLVGRRGSDAGVEIAARDPSRGARQAIHRIGDALGHRISDAGAAKNEQQRCQEHAAIQRLDLLLDLLLPRRQRHREDAVFERRVRRTGMAATR